MEDKIKEKGEIAGRNREKGEKRESKKRKEKKKEKKKCIFGGTRGSVIWRKGLLRIVSIFEFT